MHRHHEPRVAAAWLHRKPHGLDTSCAIRWSSPGRGRRRAAAALLFFGMLLLPLGMPGVFAQNGIDMDALEAQEEFGWGVRAYHRGYFEDAVLSFQRALALAPDDARARLWLGRAYYRAGLESAALDEWRTLLELGEDSLFLRNEVARMEHRRGVSSVEVVTEPYVMSEKIDGQRGDIRIFRRPAGIAPGASGTMVVSSFLGYELVVLDPNGRRVNRFTGGLEGFDAPFDLVAYDEGFFVSEFGGDRIAKLSDDGERKAEFGTSGLGDGELLGPQYLAWDEVGYLYVSDWGNRRVVRFDEDGEYLGSVGFESSEYDGLREPGGVAVLDGRLYVGDQGRDHVAVFDRSGNFLEILGDGQFSAPEGVSRFSDSELMVVDDGAIYVLNVENDTVRELADLSDDAERLTRAVRDNNGRVVVTDFDQGAVFVLTERPGLYTGLDVQIERVYADDFPEVAMDVRVRNRNGDPIAGLGSENFMITEARADVGDPELLYAGDRDEELHVSLVLDRPDALRPERSRIEDIIREVVPEVREHGSIRIFSADAEPSLLEPPGMGVETLVDSTLRQLQEGDARAPAQTDVAFQDASAKLFAERGARSVLFVSTGEVADDAFDRHDVDELARRMVNNGVRFSVLLFGAELASELEYLVTETGGTTYEAGDARGLEPLVSKMRTGAHGLYTLQFETDRHGDFGREYIPVEVQAVLAQQTGRDELGYFAPFDL